MSYRERGQQMKDLKKSMSYKKRREKRKTVSKFKH